MCVCSVPLVLLLQVIIDFLKTGKYRWWVPFLSSVRFTDPRAPKANDFVGLNYYRSGWVVKGFFSSELLVAGLAAGFLSTPVCVSWWGGFNVIV